MKICFSNPTTLMRRPISEISKRLGKKFEVTVLTPRKILSERDNKLNHSKINNVNVIDYPAISPPVESDWPMPSPAILVTLWKLLKKNDVIHLWVPMYLTNTLLCLMKLFFFKDKKLIITMDAIHGYSHERGWLDWYFKLYYFLLGPLVFKSADKVILYGESMREHASKAGIPEEKITLVPTGVDKAKKKERSVRKELDIGKSPFVLYVGLLVDRKGIDNILKTAKMFPDVYFVLVGGGFGKDKYERMAEKMNNVIFTGFRKDVHNFYNEADIFFFPSRGEGFAGVIMEAMSYGLPIVTSEIPGTVDLVKKNTGVLCAIENVDCYISNIKKLLSDEKKRSELGKNARKRIRKFNWENSLKQLKKIYSS